VTLKVPYVGTFSEVLYRSAPVFSGLVESLKRSGRTFNEPAFRAALYIGRQLFSGLFSDPVPLPDPAPPANYREGFFRCAQSAVYYGHRMPGTAALSAFVSRGKARPRSTLAKMDGILIALRWEALALS